jgi:hypothetical protein
MEEETKVEAAPEATDTPAEEAPAESAPEEAREPEEA